MYILCIYKSYFGIYNWYRMYLFFAGYNWYRMYLFLLQRREKMMWSDALVYLWTFYLWTVMRCPLPLCVPRHSAHAAGVPGNNCMTLTMCSLTETHRRFALSWKQSERNCWWNCTWQVQGQGKFLMSYIMYILDICIIYTWNILCISKNFALYIQKIWIGYTLYMPSISQVMFLYMHDIYHAYTMDIKEFWTVYPENLNGIYIVYVKYIPTIFCVYTLYII